MLDLLEKNDRIQVAEVVGISKESNMTICCDLFVLELRNCFARARWDGEELQVQL